MSIIENPYIIQNMSQVLSALFFAFILSFLLTPFIGRLASFLGAVDLPAYLRKKNERGIETRIHTESKLKLGGLAMVVSIFIVLIATGTLVLIPKGVILGVIVITVLGFLDDIFDLSSVVQLLFQVLAAFLVVLSGISITSISFLETTIDFNWFSALFELANFSYNFIFPADFITIFWIVGMINVINWVGGIDGLNGSVSSIALFTILVFTLGAGNIPLAIMIGIHLGSVLGVLPFNYPPSKIFYGSIGDYLNGFLLAIFAIFASTRWAATLVLLGLPIIDGLFVVISRIRTNPELAKKPWKIFSVSDKNHLHHRLMSAGYSNKTVLLIEISIMAILCSIAVYFSEIRLEVISIILALTIIFVLFSLIFFLKKRNEKLESSRRNQILLSQTKEAVVKVVYKESEEDEKFTY